ncbi:SDR family oxidoreductase [Streptococcus salivarius]|uniref:SDR family oxidoreductase n=1 Tax=Streptococcus TaxID=1301 RepID=UPI00352D1C55
MLDGSIISLWKFSTPIKRWIEPSEIAEVSLFLASGHASAMQGQILTIDGGWSLK